MGYNPVRLAHLRKTMKERGIDAFYVRELSNIMWVTGFDHVFDTEDAHALLITQKDAVLHSDMRYGEALEREAAGSDIVISTKRASHASILFEVLQGLGDFGAQATDISDSDRTSSVDPELSSQKQIAPMRNEVRIGIEDTLRLGEYHTLEHACAQNADFVAASFVEVSGCIESLREVKDEVEITTMRQAQAITDRAFERILGFMEPGMTEREVQLQLDQYLFEEGAEGLAFDTIVATGAHASSPHAIPGQTTLQIGDAVVMDFGARFGGYCSDMTRTVFIGSPSEELAHAFKTLQQVNEACEAAICEGVDASTIHQLAEDMLAQAGYAKRMGHSLGHSVGIDIHEGPNLSPANNKPLCTGNVVTVEPGIYIPGKFGMRLEDFGVVTTQGFDVFTQSSHKMFIIDKLH